MAALERARRAIGGDAPPLLADDPHVVKLKVQPAELLAALRQAGLVVWADGGVLFWRGPAATSRRNCSGRSWPGGLSCCRCRRRREASYGARPATTRTSGLSPSVGWIGRARLLPSRARSRLGRSLALPPKRL